MPQLDPTSFSPQLVWLAITFVVLYLVMAKVALPRVGQVLDERQSRIEDSLETAAQLRDEAMAADEAYRKSLAEARAEAQTAVREMTERLAAEAAARQAELAKTLNAQIAEAEGRIVAARDAGMAQIRDMAADVSKGAVKALAGIDADDALVGSAVDAALKERSR